MKVKLPPTHEVTVKNETGEIVAIVRLPPPQTTETFIDKINKSEIELWNDKEMTGTPLEFLSTIYLVRIQQFGFLEKELAEGKYVPRFEFKGPPEHWRFINCQVE